MEKFILFFNILRIVDLSSLSSFLETTNYDKTLRPYFYDEKPVNIKVQMFIHKMGPIDEADFTFHFGFYMRQWWTDPRFISNHTKFTESTFLDDLIWIPDTAIADSEELESFKNAVRTVINHATGDVYLSRRLKAATKCEMNLKFYPMDSQVCQIILENYAFTTKNVEIFWHSKPVVKTKSIIMDGYKLLGVTTESNKIDYNVGNETQYFKQLIVNVKVHRTYMYHVFRAYIPSILLLAFAFGTFWVPDTAVPARMGMIVTSFLSNTFILQGVTENTVKVPYITSMQYFLMVTVVMIVLSLLEYLIILQLRRISEKKAKAKEEESMVQQYANAFYQNGSSHSGNVSHRAQIDKLNTDKKNRRYGSSRQPTSIEENRLEDVHVIDRISQVLFPLSYFSFCVFYFMYYRDE